MARGASGARPELRVLCVDDEDDSAALLRRALASLRRPFHLEHARTHDEARELLLCQHFCVAFVDLVLDPRYETDPEDWEGLRIIDEIAELGLSGHLSVVILTQYPRPEHARWAFLRHRIADYIAKSSYEDLRQKVAGVVERGSSFGLDCEVTLDDRLDWAAVVDRISRGALRSLASRVTPEMATVEMDHVVRQLFADSHALCVSELSGGRTATAVVRVARRLARGDVARPAVVKIGEAAAIERERDGYESVSEYLAGMRSTQLEGFHRGVYVGALRYSLIGGGARRLLPFGEYCVQADTTQVVQTLRGLFQDTCGLFYEPRNRRKADRLDLVAAYREALGIDMARLERGYEFKFGQLLTDRRTVVHHDLDVDLPNAVLAFKEGRIRAVADSFLCPTHGDLHGDNIVVDPEDGGAWLIDFGSAGTSHWARDFALLECSVRYQLLQTSELAALHRLERELLAAGSLTSAPDLDGVFDGELHRAGRLIRTIRECAADAAAGHPAAFTEYNVALLMTSLLYLQFHGLLNRKWRKWQVMMTLGCLLEWISPR